MKNVDTLDGASFEEGAATPSRSWPGIIPASWAYDATDPRDQRIDFMRGFVMFILVVVHIDIFSVYNFIVWEKIGVVSGGEGFVILSGLVLGTVNRKKVDKHGIGPAIDTLLNRAFQIYRVNVGIIIAVFLLALIPFLDASSINSFTNHASGQVYSLMPDTTASFKHIVSSALLLKIGPHQTQVLGLYVVLLLLSPLAFLAFRAKRTGALLAICWILYFYNWTYPGRPTGAQFEYAFPVLSWQLTFFHAMAFGYFRKECEQWFTGYRKTVMFSVSVVLFLAFAFFAWNNPNPALPEWARLSFIPSEQYYAIYGEYFRKNTLGILRVLNYLVVLVVIFKVLTVFWKPLYRLIGWWCVPIGQATLYVFILHVFMCMLIDNVQYFTALKPFYGSGNIWINTAGHTFVLFALWVLVVNRFAFRWIPR